MIKQLNEPIRQTVTTELDINMIKKIDKLYWSVSNLDKLASILGVELNTKISKEEFNEDILKHGLNNMNTPIYKVGEKELTLEDLELVTNNFIKTELSEEKLDQIASEIKNKVNQDYFYRICEHNENTDKVPASKEEIYNAIEDAFFNYCDEQYDPLTHKILMTYFPKYDEFKYKIYNMLTKNETIKFTVQE